MQAQIDDELSQAEQQATLPAVDFPAAAFSTAYPQLPAADRSDATAYALAFITELLNRNYTTQSRQSLLAWAQAESSPNSLPGVPASLAPDALVLSLADPAAPTGPLPSAFDWSSYAQTEEVDSAQDLQAVVAPVWLSLTATGWRPRDPDMTILAVTGTVVVRNSAGIRSESFSLDLMLGTSAHSSGYGAIAVDDWAVM